MSGHPFAFASRHLGSSSEDVAEMLTTIGAATLDGLIDQTLPPAIRTTGVLDRLEAATETEALAELKAIMGQNKLLKSCIGQGYYGTITPPVIQRNVLENPGWYTAYTPYQAEISQGRLEALLNYQTMICELTGLDVSNASLLDEATAAAEAVTVCAGSVKFPPKCVFISSDCFAQTIAVVRTRLEPLGLEVIVGDHRTFDFTAHAGLFAVLLQYPAGDGAIHDYRPFITAAHAAGALAIVAADLLALTLIEAPGEFGADIAVGSTQRFGVPMGYGGPHAGYMAVKDELKRRMPGRLIGVSIDSHGQPAMRLSLQTREQHIRRDKATSNICTAQVLLAVMAALYASYHGPEGLKKIALQVHGHTVIFADAVKAAGFALASEAFFDTVVVKTPGRAAALLQAAREKGYNLREIDADHVGLSFDETTTPADVLALLAVFGAKLTPASQPALPRPRQSDFLTQPAFSLYHTEHEMLRYLHRLEARDVALNQSMIPLGSCTMKLNATAEMMPLTWPEVGSIHPHVPANQARGYAQMFEQLESWLAEITGFAAVSLQPNAGSQGEYAGLLAIREYHKSRGEGHRRACLIPTSAHGTNPASAVMAGMSVVPVKCDERGNIDLADLTAQVEKHSADLAALMVTYPSTHGVFEESIRDICALIHQHGGQVYMDGANMNAQVGLTSPGFIGADVCHLNLHKTFCIPHGGGGPGVGPIGVAAQLVPFLPERMNHDAPGHRPGPVSAAPWGSASICTISWMYIRLMGGSGLREATRFAILNANYVAKKLAPYFPTLYTGRSGTVAHECILDLRHFKDTAGISVEDVAKRLIDYGFHAPTMSWPVPGTLMVEPTESESKAELDRFCDAMIRIHAEIRAVATGQADRTDNVLRHAPHTASAVVSDTWSHPYSRESAAFPAPWLRHAKYWPPVGRVDNVHGDKHLVCTCASVEEHAAEN